MHSVPAQPNAPGQRIARVDRLRPTGRALTRTLATGGLYTPTLTVGSLLGGLLGLAWTELWPGALLGAYAYSARISAAVASPATRPIATAVR